MNLIRSRQRVADHGEVFTPPWLVEKMLELVEDETARIDSRFLEPACGSGNFLVPVLQRKLAAVEAKYGRNVFERRHFALLGLMCIYGIELLPDNIAECRANLLKVFADFLTLSEDDDLYQAASAVLDLNLVQGDAMTMRDPTGGPITVVEWGYLGKGKFQRRDFRLDEMTKAVPHWDGTAGAVSARSPRLFGEETFYPPLTVHDLAAGRCGGEQGNAP